LIVKRSARQLKTTTIIYWMKDVRVRDIEPTIQNLEEITQPGFCHHEPLGSDTDCDKGPCGHNLAPGIQ
jgi:hypothetical protein